MTSHQQTDYSLSSMFKLESVVAVVTGGGTGIGQYMAAALAKNGATVYIIGRRQAKLEETIKLYGNGRMKALVGDVTKKEDLLRMAKEVEADAGYVTIAVCNSGVMGQKPSNAYPNKSTDIKELQKAMWDIDFDNWGDVFKTNVTSVYYTAVAFLHLLSKGTEVTKSLGYDSSILTISSIGGNLKVLSSNFAYQTSKAGATHLGKVFAEYFSTLKIRSNVISPGIFPSEMTVSTKDDGTVVSSSIKYA